MANTNLYIEIENIAFQAKVEQEKVKDKCVSKSLRLKNIRGNLEVERKYYRKDNTKLQLLCFNVFNAWD